MTASSNNKTILFDGDVLVYRSGFSSETRSHVLTSGDTVIESSHVKILKDFVKGLDIGTYTLSVKQDAYPVEFACGNLKATINSVLKKYNTTSYRVFLSESGIENNERYKLTNTLCRVDEPGSYDNKLLYKSNRKNALKPLHYDRLREYLLKHHAAETVQGIEADDALGINQTKDTVIASIDKDLMMIPGSHYNINTKKMTEAFDPGNITLDAQPGKKTKKFKGHGFKWFCAQMLVGDAIDNIYGIHGIGPVKAFKLLDEAEDMADMWKVVQNSYRRHYGQSTCINKKCGKCLYNMLELNSRLLWIQRKEFSTVHEFIAEQLRLEHENT